MKKTRKFLLILCAGILLSSCATVSVASLQRTSEREVPVFTTRLPDREYSELKYIQVDGSVVHHPEKLLKKLAERAKKEGADAVISVRFGYLLYLPYVSGTAIKYK